MENNDTSKPQENLALQGDALQNQNSTPPPPLPPVQPAQPPVYKTGDNSFLNSKWLKIGVIIIVLIILLGGTIVLGGKLMNKPQTVTTTVTENQTPTVSPVPTADPTASWKTYTNDKFGFTFKYPQDWKTTTPYDPASSPYLDLNLGLAPSSKVKTGKEFVVTVEHYNNPGNLSIQDWDKKENGEKPRGHLLYSSSTKSANLPDLTAYVNENGDCEPVLCKEVIIMGDKKVIILRNIDFTNMDYTKEEIESYKPVFDQMLSTFKFTDQTTSTDTSTWKMYPVTGQYEFKYPIDNYSLSSENSISYEWPGGIRVKPNDAYLAKNPKDDSSFFIYATDNKNHLTLNDGPKLLGYTQSTMPSGLSQKQINIGDIKGIRFDNIPNQGYPESNIFIISNGNKISSNGLIYTIVLSGQNDLNANSTAEKILSTFKFTQ